MPPKELIPLRNSEAATFRRCGQQWLWHYVRSLEPKRRKGALTFGTLGHMSLEKYYPPGKKRGVHPAKTFKRLYEENAEEFSQWDDEGNKVNAEELGIAMMNGYVERYGKDPDIEVIQPEKLFEIDVYDRDGSYLITMMGKYDMIVRNLRTGRIVIFEHKTGKSIELVRINSGYGNQGMTYWWAANLQLRHEGILTGEEYVDGVWFNFLRKALPDDRPQDENGLYLNKPTRAEKKIFGEDYPGTPSKRQPPPLFGRQELILRPEQLLTFEKRLRRQAMVMNKTRERRLPVYKNPTKDCSWDCPFVDACEIHEMGGDWEGVLEMEFKVWDPYEEHELELELKA